MIVTAWGRQITVDIPITVQEAVRGTGPYGRAGAPGAVRARAARAKALTPPTGAAVTDLRARTGGSPRRLLFAAGDIVVVSGLPGSGKSTLMQRTVPDLGIDSQDMRDRWARRMPRWLPYAVYRPLVRLAHYRHLRRTLRTGAGLVVHDCGTQAWVRRWLAREAARRHRALHLVLLDVPPDLALAGQGARGRQVSRYAFGRHRRAVGKLIRGLAAGHLPPGCTSAVLLDRSAANALRTIRFGTGHPAHRG